MTIKILCDGCGETIKDTWKMPMEGKIRPRMYEDASNLRNPQDANFRLHPVTFHWCDECATVAQRAVKEANAK